MNDRQQQFQKMVEDLGRQVGLTMRVSEDGNDIVIPVGGGSVEVSVSYRPASGLVVAYAVVGPFEPSANDEMRDRMLLELNWRWSASRGFTVAVDDATSALIVVGRRPAVRFVTATDLGNYIASLAGLVRSLRRGLVELDETSERLLEEAAEEMSEQTEEAGED